MGYAIVGDTEKYKGCLVIALKGNWTRDKAEARLQELLASTDEMDKRAIAGHTNIRVRATEPENEWWNESALVK